MDRYFAWLIVDAKLNPNAEIPAIFRPAHPKLVTTGFVAAMIMIVFLASLGYVVYD